MSRKLSEVAGNPLSLGNCVAGPWRFAITPRVVGLQIVHSCFACALACDLLCPSNKVPSIAPLNTHANAIKLIAMELMLHPSKLATMGPNVLGVDRLRL